MENSQETAGENHHKKAFLPPEVKLQMGYTINKLFEDRRIGGKHLPVELLSHGYPPKYRHLIREAYDSLKCENQR